MYRAIILRRGTSLNVMYTFLQLNTTMIWIINDLITPDNLFHLKLIVNLFKSNKGVIGYKVKRVDRYKFFLK